MDDGEFHESDNDTEVSQTGSSCISTFIYSQYKMREGLAKYITPTGLLFTSADHVRFERFIEEYMQPEYCSVPLNTIRGDCLKAFNQMKNKLISELSSLNGSISFTSNFWSSSDNRLGFICVTAHFIDSAWMLQKRIIAFRMIEYPHNDNAIFQCMMDIFREYLIDDKVFSITFDDAIYNDAIVDMLKNTLQPPYGGQCFHMKCLCHMINLIVQEGLKLMETHIEKIREAILYNASSPTRQQEFSALCESLGLKCRKFKPDMNTHWNSTFLMLQSCVNYNAVISDFYNGKQGGSNLLCETDWEISFVFMEFLKVFYYSTFSLNSNVYSPTSCDGLDLLYSISVTFSKHRGHSGFKAIHEVMESKFKNYCECMLPNICLAAAMDPRVKVFGVGLILDKISQNLSMPLNRDAKAVEILLHDLYKVYKSKFANKTKPTTDSNDRRLNAIAMLQERRRQIEAAAFPTEVHKYLEVDYVAYMTEQEYDNFEILAWWKLNKGKFSVLSIMARDILTTPMSAMASEFVFSTTGKQVLDHKRGKQPPKILDCIFCMKDWEDARLRAQSWTDDMAEYFADLDQDNDYQ